MLFGAEPDYGVVSLHHVGILCENLERSMAFYKDLLGELAFCYVRCISAVLEWLLVKQIN